MRHVTFRFELKTNKQKYKLKYQVTQVDSLITWDVALYVCMLYTVVEANFFSNEI